MTCLLFPSTEADARELEPRLRAVDRTEVLTMGIDPLDGLLASVRGSDEAWTVRADGEIVFMIGVCPLSTIGRVGVPWLLGSDLVSKHRRTFMVETRRLLAVAHRRFPILRNYIHDGHRQALRWMDWLGFMIRDPQPIGSGLFWIAEREAA